MADSGPYTSSIINNYGDMDRVRDDVKTLNEILGRQGSNLLLDVIAESAGETAIKFKLNANERYNIKENLMSHLSEALMERL